ncbi:hypothetical protein Dimus_037311 [Dionaea muscipula]
MKKVNQVKVEDGEVQARLGCRRSARISHPSPVPFSALDAGRVPVLPMADEIDASLVVSDDVPGRCASSDPRCASDLDLRFALPPILEEEGLVGGKIQSIVLSIEEERGSTESEIQSSAMRLAGGEFQKSDGDGRLLIGFGQYSSVLPDMPCQVVSIPSSLLPVEFSSVGVDEQGEGAVISMQGPLLHHVPEAMPVGLSTTKDLGGQTAQLLQVQGLDCDSHDVGPLTAVKDMGNCHAVQGGPAVSLAYGGSVGRGDLAENSGDLPGVQLILNGDEQVLDNHLGIPMMAGEELGSFKAEVGVAHGQAEGLGNSRAVAVKGNLATPLADAVSGVQVRRSGGGSPEVGTTSRFAPLSELDEDSVEDDCGDRGVLDREGHRLASSCVDALFDACEVIGDGPETARGGTVKGRGRGGRRGGSTRGRGGRSRGRGPS